MALEAVMAGLVPAIHDLLPPKQKDVDARDKPGHDGEWITGMPSKNCVD
jgi:hypothetical protein